MPCRTLPYTPLLTASPSTAAAAAAAAILLGAIAPTAPARCLGFPFSAAKDGDGEGQQSSGALHRWMTAKGVVVQDIPRVGLTFYCAKWATFCLSLGFCIKCRPLRRTFGRPGAPQRWLLSFKARYPGFYARAHQKVLKSADYLAASRFFRPIPLALGTKPKLFALALAENIVFYKITFPIHAPLELWLIIEFYARLRRAGWDDAGGGAEDGDGAEQTPPPPLSPPSPPPPPPSSSPLPGAAPGGGGGAGEGEGEPGAAPAPSDFKDSLESYMEDTWEDYRDTLEASHEFGGLQMGVGGPREMKGR
jgi:hypothetical protein